MMKRMRPVAALVLILLTTACRRGTTGAGQGAAAGTRPSSPGKRSASPSISRSLRTSKP
jgi:hypothetical protein